MTKHGRMEFLLGKKLCGNLDPNEQEELRSALESDPELAGELARDARFHLLISLVLEQANDSGRFERSLVARLKATKGDTAFIHVLEAKVKGQAASVQEPLRIAPRPPTRRTRRHDPMGQKPWWGVWALAAAGLLGVVALLTVLSPSEPSSVASQKSAQARSRAMREAEVKRQAERDRLEREQAWANAEAQRQGAEAYLREIEEKRKLLAQAKPEPGDDPQAKEKREKDLAELKRDQDRIEQELRQAAELAKKAAPATAPVGPQEVKPLTPQKDPASPSQSTTQAEIAQVEEVAGEAFRLTKMGRSPLTAGATLFVADGLATGTGASRVVLRFPDKTGLELGPNTTLAEIKTDSGKRLTLNQGMVRAIVSKQPKDQPMILKTPHGQAKVVGTTLRIVIDPDPKKGTRLEVEEGKVELKNLAEKTVLVESGHYAVAAAGVELVAKPLAADEIVLFPWQAHLVGGEWALVPDSAAQGGSSLFSRKTSYQIKMVGANRADSVYSGLKGRASYVQFSFFAEGGKDYWVWLRGKSLPEDLNHVTTAEVGAEFPTGQLNSLNTPISLDATLSADRAHNFNGFFKFPGYGWIGGNGEHPEQGKADEVPLSVRFPRSGMQTLKLHTLQAPAWIDAIWMSSTQRTRPDARAAGPAGK